MKTRSAYTVASLVIACSAVFIGTTHADSTTEPSPNNSPGNNNPGSGLNNKIPAAQLKAQSMPAAVSPQDVQRETVLKFDSYGKAHDKRYYGAAAGDDPQSITIYRTPVGRGVVAPSVQTGDQSLEVAYTSMSGSIRITYKPATFSDSDKHLIANSVSAQTEALEKRGISLTWWSTETADGPFVIRYDPSGRTPTLADIALPGPAVGRVVLKPGTMTPLSRTADNSPFSEGPV